MDFSLITLIIGYVGLLSSTKAQFPFQTGPLLYDPYASFFGSEELNPFASNDMRIAVPHHHHRHHPKRPAVDKHRNRLLNDKFSDMGEHRNYHKKVYETEPSKWRKYSRTSFTRPSKKNFKKMSVPAPKLNDYNKALIRPRPESDVDSIQKQISFQTNHFNPKPVINYKNSNSFRDLVPRKPLLRDNHSSNRESEKRTDFDSDDEPSTLDIELNGDEDNEEYHRNRHENRDRSKVQFSSPPNQMTPFKPHNYAIKEKAYTFDNTRHNRPAFYEIEPPKNLDKKRPSHDGPTFIHKIPVPHKTLMEIADITGPPRPPTSRRPHPFEGFHQHPKPKPESEIIVNSLGDSMTRQVGASMSVQLEDRKFQPKGKIFDEPIAGSERRPFGKSYEHKPFRPNEGNPFNSKHFDSFSSNGNNNNNNEFEAVESLKRNENPFPYAESKSDDDYDDSSNDNQEVNNDFDKPSNNDEESTKRPQMKPYSSRRPPPLEESEAQQSDEDDDSAEEWSSNGIPGQPGKDYPMLSSVPLNSQFSCMKRPHGFYADVSQKCQVYHQCSTQGSQKFLCPNGTLFNQESLVCEWWYNVLCENSEQLYHKNAQLYRNDDRKQNDDISNDENRHNPNEYKNSWSNNNRNNPNDNHNNDNNNNYHNSNHNNNHNNNNHNPHNHYSNNNFKANSDRNSDRNSEMHSRAPDPEYDEEIDVDLSNDESRNKFIKVLSTHQLVSKLNAFNKTKNAIFQP